MEKQPSLLGYRTAFIDFKCPFEVTVWQRNAKRNASGGHEKLSSEGIQNRVSKGIYGEYGKVAFKALYETFKEKEAYKNENHAIWELIDKDNFDKLAKGIRNRTASFEYMVIATPVIYTAIWLDYWGVLSKQRLGIIQRGTFDDF